MKGTVKWYDRVKGYGFIQTADDKDVFIHRSGLDASHTELDAGQTVEFEIEQRGKHPGSHGLPAILSAAILQCLISSTTFLELFEIL